MSLIRANRNSSAKASKERQDAFQRADLERRFGWIGRVAKSIPQAVNNE
jgi:hypothetical protein